DVSNVSVQESQANVEIQMGKPSVWSRLFQRTSKRTDETNLAGYIFISPWLLGFLILTLWPMAQSVYLSFTNYSLLDDPVWIGLENFSTIFTNDTLFRKSLAVTFAFVIISVPLKLFFSLMVAMLLNKDVKG